MNSNIKNCPFCGMILDEKSILYKGYYVCSSCANTVNDSKNADLIRKYSNYIRNLEFKRANSLRNEMLDEANLDVNEQQLFTFYSSILDLFITKDPSKIIKFLNDSTAIDIGVAIEVINFLASLSMYIEKLGGYILKYVSMQEKYLSCLNNHEFDIALIEVKKRYFKVIQNKSSFIQDSFKLKKMSLNEIVELIQNNDPGNIAALYSVFDDVAIEDYQPDEINSYLLTCDYALELYYEKNNREISKNYREYYKKANALRKLLNLNVQVKYKWQKRISKHIWKIVSFLIILILSVAILRYRM